MMNTEIITVGYKIYIITRTSDEVIVTTVGKGSKIEKRKYRSILDMPQDEYSKIIIAKALHKLEQKR